MTELFLVRHGETRENVARILQGHLPGHLTARGISQAEALRDRLAGHHFDAFLTSDLLRARDTAAILAPAVGLSPTPTPLLRERDWGSLTGQSFVGLNPAHFPADVEPVDALFARARRFLTLVATRYAGCRVLAVTHGLFARVCRAEVAGLTIRDIPRMANADICRINLTGYRAAAPLSQGETDASAN